MAYNCRNVRKELEDELETLKHYNRLLQNRIFKLQESGKEIKKITHHFHGKYHEYYENREKKRVYLSLKSDYENIATSLQYSYDNHMRLFIENRIRLIEKFLTQYSDEMLFKKSEKELGKGPSFITPIILSDEEFIKQWYENNPGQMNPYQNISNQYDNRGNHVRSKSEKILADFFDTRGIPYIYEPLLILEDGKRVYPDFLLLDISRRKVYVFEHFGMMDDGEYASLQCEEKIRYYMKNGYYPGNNFLFSMETSKNALDIRVVENMLINCGLICA